MDVASLQLGRIKGIKGRLVTRIFPDPRRPLGGGKTPGNDGEDGKGRAKKTEWKSEGDEKKKGEDFVLSSASGKLVLRRTFALSARNGGDYWRALFSDLRTFSPRPLLS